jgi:hypothetical protein
MMFFQKVIWVHWNKGVKSNSKKIHLFQNFEPFFENWAKKFQKSAHMTKLFLHKIRIWVSKQCRIIR